MFIDIFFIDKSSKPLKDFLLSPVLFFYFLNIFLKDPSGEGRLPNTQTRRKMPQMTLRKKRVDMGVPIWK